MKKLYFYFKCRQMHQYLHSAYFKIYKKNIPFTFFVPQSNSLLFFRSSPIGSPFITVVSIAENPKKSSDNNGSHNNNKRRRSRLLRNGVEDESSIQGISKVFVQFEIGMQLHYKFSYFFKITALKTFNLRNSSCND